MLAVKFYDLARLRQEECVWQHDQRTGALPRQLDKSGLDLARRACLKGRDDSSAHTGILCTAPPALDTTHHGPGERNAAQDRGVTGLAPAGQSAVETPNPGR